MSKICQGFAFLTTYRFHIVVELKMNLKLPNAMYFTISNLIIGVPFINATNGLRIFAVKIFPYIL